MSQRGLNRRIFARRGVRSWGKSPMNNASRAHRAREPSGQLRRVIDLPAGALLARLAVDDDCLRREDHKKKHRVLEHRQMEGCVDVPAARPVGAVFRIRTRRMIRRRLLGAARPIRAGIESLAASHQEKGQRTNDPDLPVDSAHRGSCNRAYFDTCQLRSCSNASIESGISARD